MAATQTGRIKVLIIEPDPQQRQQLVSILQSRYTPIAVSNLAEAREAAMTHRPPVILLELDQPDGDGMDFLRQVRETPALQHVIMCCVTKRSSVRDKVRAFQSGADDYVVKPVNSETFLFRVVLLTRIRQVTPGGEVWTA